MGNSHSVAIKAFYKIFLESTSEEESNGEIDLLIAAAVMVHDHYLMVPRRVGSSKKRLPNIDRDREAGHLRLYKDYSDPIYSIFKEKAFHRR
jgi:hypothetical protein